MIEHGGTQIFHSPLDNTLQVVVIYPESEKYEMVVQQFQESGHAFLLHDANLMVVDGAAVEESWFTMDHLLVIQAHELGHYRAGHGKSAHAKGDVDIEMEADWLGYRLLISKGERTAAELHREEYQSRYGSDPEEDSVKFEEKLGKFVN